MSVLALSEDKKVKAFSGLKALIAAVVTIVMALALAMMPQSGAQAASPQIKQAEDFYGVQVEEFEDGSFAMTVEGSTTTVTIDDETQLMTVTTESGVTETVDLAEIASGGSALEVDGQAVAAADSNIVCSVILYAVSLLRTYGLGAMIAALIAAGAAGAVALAVVYAVGTEGFLIWVGTKC
ncbi:hypothetical protein JSO19_03785 [Leucobacter sp. UCMA 4100]|uniref:hypothetical protein n=1 Tax=Leucobacter TaxID=55968 RepID=UPI001C23098A|nr:MULTISPECIES: hypothetical protein [Leucobacter]MDA3146496.1 hypothetical protein [Leucobacter sp. UCMA 4100]